MKTAILQTVLVRENAASFLWSHAWLKPGEKPHQYLPGSKELARLMQPGGGTDREGWRHVSDGSLCRFPNASCIKAALDSAGFVEGVDYKDGKPTECLYL